MNALKSLVVILGFLIPLFVGCQDSMEDYKKTVRSGIQTVPHVKEIEKLFPNAPTDHFITNYGFDKEKPKKWNTVVYLYGRYVLTYQVDAMVDYDRNRIDKMVSKPSFDLWELAEVLDPQSDHVGAKYKPGYSFDETKWNKLVASNGDFSAIGITIETNTHIKGFDQYIHQWRKDRIQVEP